MLRLSLSFATAAFAAVLGLSPVSAGQMAAGGMEHHSAAQAAVGSIAVSDGWAKAMLPGQPTGGGYLTIINNGKEADRLVGASSPSAGKVEVHTMEMSNDVMVMRPVEGGVEIPAGATVELKPGANHLMFMKVGEPFKEGGTVPLTLEFEKAGKVEVELPVAPANSKGGHMNMKMDKD
jgi:copper(I)-binding protein